MSVERQLSGQKITLIKVDVHRNLKVYSRIKKVVSSFSSRPVILHNKLACKSTVEMRKFIYGVRR